MIIFENEKYACIQCIRGHRSTTCKHANRMLVKVRSRGRPAPAGVRKVIMVDKSSQSDLRMLEHIKKESDHGFQGSPTASEALSCCSSMNASPGEQAKQGSDNCCNSSSTGSSSTNNKADNLDSATAIEPALVEASESVSEITSSSRKSCCSQIQNKPDKLTNMQQSDKKTCQNGNSKESKSCSGMSNQPILFLKAKHQSLGNLVNGQLNLIDDTNLNTGLKKNSYTQASQSYKKVLISEIESKENSLEPQDINTVCHSKGKDNGEINYKEIASLRKGTRQSEKDQSLFELFTQEGLFLSTSCSCSEDCECPNCLIHRKDEELNRYIEAHSMVPLSNMGYAELETNHSLQSLSSNAKSSPASSLNDYPRNNNSGVQNMNTPMGTPMGHGSAFQQSEMTQALNSWSHNSIKNPNLFATPHMNNATSCRFTEFDCIDINCRQHSFQIISLNTILWQGLMNTKLTRKTGIKFKNRIVCSKHWWDFLAVQIPHMAARDQASFDQFDIITWFTNILELYQAELLIDMGDYNHNIESMKHNWVVAGAI
ncbi:hypothetical protein ACO0QE_001961 [Hanseniaspora vineae]